MADKLDTLFSPDRLRGKWLNKNDAESHDQKIENHLPRDEHTNLYMKIMKSINDRCSGNDLEFLQSLMEELENLLNLRFKGKEQPCPPEKTMEINLAIDKILSTIEDIV